MAKSKPVNLYFRLEAAAWYAFAGGLRLLGVENAAKLGAAVVPAVGSLNSAHKTSLRNIRMCFPEETEKWHRDLRAAAWREVGRMSGEFPNMDAMDSKYLVLPLHMGMTVKDVDRICGVIRSGW